MLRRDRSSSAGRRPPCFRAQAVARVATFTLAVAWAGLSAMWSGCGPSPQAVYPVHGFVYYNGVVWHGGGSVTFTPVDGRPFATAEIQLDGSYVLRTRAPGDGAVAGPHRVTVVAYGRQSRDGDEVSLFPEKYREASTTDIELEVRRVKANSVDVRLEGPPVVAAPQKMPG